VIYYRVTVQTGESGLPAGVEAFVVLIGEHGESKELHLERQGPEVFAHNRFVNIQSTRVISSKFSI